MIFEAVHWISQQFFFQYRYFILDPDYNFSKVGNEPSKYWHLNTTGIKNLIFFIEIPLDEKQPDTLPEQKEEIQERQPKDAEKDVLEKYLLTSGKHLRNALVLLVPV